MKAPGKVTWGPKAYRKRDAEILAYIKANIAIAGLGLSQIDTAAGRVLNADPGGQGGSAAPAVGHPFKVSLRNSGTEESPEWEWSVALKSNLYKSLRPNDKQTITGLDTWFPAIATDAIWLGIVFDSSGAITSVSIDSWGQGDAFDITQAAWSGENGYCEDDGAEEFSVHQTSRKLIAYSVAGEAGQPLPTQVMFRDQAILECNIDGRFARYPFAHEGGYPL